MHVVTAETLAINNKVWGGGGSADRLASSQRVSVVEAWLVRGHHMSGRGDEHYSLVSQRQAHTYMKVHGHGTCRWTWASARRVIRT